MKFCANYWVNYQFKSENKKEILLFGLFIQFMVSNMLTLNDNKLNGVTTITFW